MLPKRILNVILKSKKKLPGQGQLFRSHHSFSRQKLIYDNDTHCVS